MSLGSMVRTRGLEPPHLAAPDPKSGVSTNSTTSAGFEKVVRPSGFEPETYGLEGRCSIQLSYGRMKSKVARPGGVEPPAYGSEVRRSIQLSYGRNTGFTIIFFRQPVHFYGDGSAYGVGDGNRTHDPQCHKLVL